MDSLTLEERMQLAIKAIQSGASQRSVASTFNVPRSTLQDRLASMQPNKVSKQHMQRLTVEEEGALCRILQQMHLQGQLIGITSLECFAQQLLQQKGDFEPLSAYNTLFYLYYNANLYKCELVL